MKWITLTRLILGETDFAYIYTNLFSKKPKFLKAIFI